MSLLHTDLDVFLAVCDAKSFSLAAKQLGLTQSAVTKKIRHLEDNFGVDLFDRSKRPIGVTKEGKVLMRQSLLARTALERTALEIREGAFLRPEIRIGTIDSLSKCFLPSLITGLRQDASRIYAVTGTSQRLVEAVQDHEIDFAFVSSLFSEMKNLNRLQIFEEPSVLLMPSKFAERHNLNWTWDEIRCCGLPYLQYNRKGGAGRLNDSYFSLLHRDIPTRVEVDSSFTMLSLVANGSGWALTRAMSVLQAPDLTHAIRLFPLPEGELKRPLYLISRSDEPRQMVDRVASVSKGIFEKEISPKLQKLASWL